MCERKREREREREREEDETIKGNADFFLNKKNNVAFSPIFSASNFVENFTENFGGGVFKFLVLDS